MAHVVTKACYDCRYTDCVQVCPVECFYADDKMLYIDPDECIDCEACVTECPVEAIFLDINVPRDMREFIEMNAERAAALKDDGHIDDKETPLKGPECISTRQQAATQGTTTTTTTATPTLEPTPPTTLPPTVRGGSQHVTGQSPSGPPLDGQGTGHTDSPQKGPGGP